MSSPWWRTDAREWRSHDWRLELRGDEIADISHRGIVVLRAVRAVVRDRGWQTVPVVVQSVDGDADVLALTLRHEGLGARVCSTLTVRARAGELVIEWDAVNEVDFDTCRIGLVVLHPASDAGRAVIIDHDDGSEERTSFPRALTPHQPMRDIRRLRIDGGASIAFAGDVFEMEDQRNWTDASFKTYSRPLDLPYPYALRAGETVRQAITIGAPDASIAADPGRGSPVVIELRECGPFPAVGVEASTAPDPVPASSAGSFRVVELDLTTPAWAAALVRASSDGLPLDIRIVSDGDARAADAVAATLAGLPVLRVTVFDRARHVTTPASASLFRAALGSAGIRAPLLAGARSHFTELNREQATIPRDTAGIVVTTTPLFHALDTEQLVEAVAVQRLVAEETVRIAEGREVHIGPVALRPRYNNVATTAQPAPTRSDLADGYGAQFTGADDERQGAPELAAWVIASAAASAVPGVRSLSWFETWGPRGLEDRRGRMPAADAVDALADLRGSVLLGGSSPDGLVWAIGGRAAERDTILIANLDVEPRVLDVRADGGAPVRVSVAAGSWERV